MIADYKVEGTPRLVVQSERASDGARKVRDAVALREFAEAASKNSASLRIAEVLAEADGDSADRVVIEVVHSPDPTKFQAGYGANGWGDRFTDEVSRDEVDLQLEHELTVRPTVPTVSGEPPHGFVACVRLVVRSWDGAMDWGPPSEPTVVYYGEHASLAVGAKAARKAYDRSLALRAGPGFDE